MDEKLQKEYEEFLNNKEIKECKSRGECQDPKEFIKQYMEWIDKHERRFGLGIIWTLKKKGNKLRKIKRLTYVGINNGTKND